MNAPDRRYCEDCRYSSNTQDAPNARCSRPRDTTGVEYVSRAAVKPLAYCDLLRADHINGCGPIAAWFEPKPSIAQAAE